MYRRADLSRTTVLVVALLLAAVSAGAFAREFCASDSQARHLGTEQEQMRTGAIGLNRTNVALIGTITPLLVGRHRT